MECGEAKAEGGILMTIGFILNGEDVVADAGAAIRLVDILRNNFALAGTKSGCCSGNCGACSVKIGRAHV